MDGERTYIDALADNMARPMRIDFHGVPVLVRPMSMVADDMSKHMPAPLRASGQVRADDTPSFISLVSSLQSDGTRIYCDADYLQSTAKLTAVINDHGEQFGWRDHRVVFTPKRSVEWTRWAERDGKPMSQIEFATHIEDNLADFATVDGLPTGAQMLEMALNLESARESRFKSAVKLQSGGVDMVFVDKDDDNTAAKMRLFDRFVLGLAPFQSGERYQVRARLRYRVKDGAVTFWYDLIRPDLVFADALLYMTNNIHQGTEIEVLFGAP